MKRLCFSTKLDFYLQRNILSIKAADGILITEVAVSKSREQELAKNLPVYLEPYNMRAAHIYRTVHSDINYGILTAGLITSTSVNKNICRPLALLGSYFWVFFSAQDFFKFDGVYYQNLMAAKAFPKDLFTSIKPYRIYVD